MEVIGNVLPVLNNAWWSFYQSLTVQQTKAVGAVMIASNQKSGRGNGVIQKTLLKSDGGVAASDALTRWNSCYSPDAEEMRIVFNRFDENQDGLICVKDLSLIMHRLGFVMTDEEVKSMLQLLDRNQDASIDFDEFFSVYNTLSGGETVDERAEDSNQAFESEEDLRQAFSVFDKDNNGLISPSELQQVLLNLGLCEGKSLHGCAKMIQSVDVDGNGQVDFNEFKVLMCSDAFQL